MSGMEAAFETLVNDLEAATRQYRASQPRTPQRLELIESISETGASFWTVIDHTRGTFADRCGSDEALGIFAAAIFGQRERKRLQYMETYAGWVARERRYRHHEEPWPEPVALLACNTFPLSTTTTGA